MHASARSCAKQRRRGSISAPRTKLRRSCPKRSKALTEYPATVQAAAANFAPSIVGAYAYELAKSFNGYYHDHSILKEECTTTRDMRLRLAEQVARTIRLAMALLGIDVPERM